MVRPPLRPAGAGCDGPALLQWPTASQRRPTGPASPTSHATAPDPTPIHPPRKPSRDSPQGGALAIALPGFQWAARSAKAPSKPLCCDAFARPPTTVDARLVAGGALFGAGWGISGACPGPALVAVAASLSPPPQIVAYVAAMCAGIWLEGAATRALAPRAGAQPA